MTSDERNGNQNAPTRRQHVPAALRRAVLLEAGHRCASPTCRQTPVELAHIEPWARVREHTFENLIALCPTCHARFDREEIDRISMRHYKWNAGLLSSRYGDLERRLLELFARDPNQIIELSGRRELDFMYLISDGIIEQSNAGADRGFMKIQFDTQAWRLTAAGHELITKLRTAERLR